MNGTLNTESSKIGQNMNLLKTGKKEDPVALINNSPIKNVEIIFIYNSNQFKSIKIFPWT